MSEKKTKVAKKPAIGPQLKRSMKTAKRLGFKTKTEPKPGECILSPCGKPSHHRRSPYCEEHQKQVRAATGSESWKNIRRQRAVARKGEKKVVHDPTVVAA